VTPPPPPWNACRRRGLPKRKKQLCMLVMARSRCLVCGEPRTYTPWRSLLGPIYRRTRAERTYRSAVLLLMELDGSSTAACGASWSRGMIRPAAWFVSWLSGWEWSR
jgi:hypothetical protein